MNAPAPPQVGVTLAYGREEWTTAVHLDSALARLTHVEVVGPGHQRSGQSHQEPLLWVESGIPWMPAVESLAGRRTAAWLIDTHRGWRWRASAAAAFCTAFVAQREAVDQFSSVGVAAEWLPLAVPADLCGPGATLADRHYDVALVGQIHPGGVRHRVLQALRAVCVLAPGGYRSPSEMMSLYRSTRIVINIPLTSDLNMRTFEALGSRALLVTGPMTGSQQLLDDLPIIVPSTNPKEWVAAVTTVLACLDQGRADRGYERVLGAHTYDHRARHILATLERTSPERRSPPELGRFAAPAWARWGDASTTWRLSHSPRLAMWAGAVRTAAGVRRSASGRRDHTLGHTGSAADSGGR